MNYAEKLKNPKWQKRRLEILNRDEFSCQYCGCKDKTLHVHHLYYRGEPWEAEDCDLTTVCEDCHSIDHLNLTDLETALVDFIRSERTYYGDKSRQGCLNKMVFSYKGLK